MTRKSFAVIFILLLLSLACSFSMPGALWKPSLPPTPDLDSANRVVVDIPEDAAPTLTPTLTPTPAFVPLEDILAAEKATKEAESPEAETESKAGICINPVLPNLFKAWNYDSLKCPAGSGVNTWAADQSFEGGYMFWRSDRKKIYVLYNGGKYREFDDTFQDGQPESDPSLSPPPGKQQPIRGFGKVWRENNLQQELGWATGRERGYRAAVQDFEGGVIFWSRIRSKAISLSGGAWGF